MKNEAVLETSNTEMVTIPRAEYEHLQAQNQWLMEQFRLLKKKVYGASSEKASEEVYEQLSLLFNEAEAFVDALEASAKEPKGKLSAPIIPTVTDLNAIRGLMAKRLKAKNE